MTEFSHKDLQNARFDHVQLGGAQFRQVDLSNAQFRAVNLADAQFIGANLCGITMRGVDLGHIDISGEIVDLKINGVDVAPLVEAELDRQYPDRVKMRPTEPAGFREARDILERLWADTVDRARRLPSDWLHVSVNGEWSFIETLRHLVFATDAWIRRAILGDPNPWDPLDLPFDELTDGPGVPRDRDARPSLEVVLALREDRMATMRKVVDELTDEQLDSRTEPVDGPGWPPTQSYSVRECLLCILNEEWQHRIYAERDLGILEARTVVGRTDR